MDHRFSGFLRRLSIILFWVILWQAGAERGDGLREQFQGFGAIGLLGRCAAEQVITSGLGLLDRLSLTSGLGLL